MRLVGVLGAIASLVVFIVSADARRTPVGITLLGALLVAAALAKLLESRVVEISITRAIDRLRVRHEGARNRQAEIDRELADIERRLRRLEHAIMANDDAPVATLVTALRREEQRKAELSAQRESLRTASTPVQPDIEDLKRRVYKRANVLIGVLSRNTDYGRQMLGRLLPRKLDAYPVEDPDGRRGYRLIGEVNVAGLLPDDVSNALGTIEQRAGGGPNRTR